MASNESIKRTHGGRVPSRHIRIRARLRQQKSTRTWRFWIVSFTVTLRPFHSMVAFWMSSPTFLGDCFFRQNSNGGGW